jgi:nitric oxide reductase activation protein
LQGEGQPDEDNDFLPNEEDDDSESFNDRQREARESDLKLLKNVNEVIEQYSDKNVNEHLEEMAEEEQWKIIDTAFGKASLPCRMKLDTDLVARLRRIFKLQKSHRSRRYHYNRGLLRGKIDGRRLYRLSMNGRLFRQKEHFYYDNTRNIVILVDGSASMTGGLPAGGKQWYETERIFVSLFEAVKGTGNRLDVYSYYERAGVCELNLLAYNKKIYTVRPSGRTPTGQAIIAAAVKMPKDKKRLIVHLTDGEPNCGVSVQKGLEFCDREGIEIVTIGTYYDEHTKELLEQQYHDRAILVDSLDSLPLRLEEVLRASLLK